MPHPDRFVLVLLREFSSYVGYQGFSDYHFPTLQQSALKIHFCLGRAPSCCFRDSLAQLGIGRISLVLAPNSCESRTSIEHLCLHPLSRYKELLEDHECETSSCTKKFWSISTYLIFTVTSGQAANRSSVALVADQIFYPWLVLIGHFPFW